MSEQPASEESVYNESAAAYEAYDLYMQTWKVAYLNTAVHLFQRAVDNAPEPDARLLGWLGSCLSKRFEALGSLDDLERALAARRHALELLPEDHHDWALRLSDLAYSLWNRFERLGELNDLELTIATQRRAVELTPDWHPDKHMWLNNLGNSLQNRFVRLGELVDLEHAITTQQRAVEIIPDGHPDKPTWMNNLGLSLHIRFERLGELVDLEHAIATQRCAVETIPDGHPNQPTCLNNLGLSLHSRFERLGKLDDLEQAIASLRRAIELTTDAHPHKPGRLNNLGEFLHVRCARLGDLEDLEQAIDAQRHALVLTPDGHPDKPIRLSNLGSSLHTRFDHLGELDDLERAITVQRRAVELTPDGHPDKPSRLKNLGLAWKSRFKRSGDRDLDDLQEALSCFMTAYAHPVGPPSERLKAAKWAVEIFSAYPQFSTPEKLMSAHSLIVDILPEIVWLGHSMKRRFEESSTTTSLITPAVHAAIGVNDLCQAVRWLEAGRSFIWSQTLSFRNPLDALEELHPDLAHRLRTIYDQLQSSAHTSSHSRPAPITADHIFPGLSSHAKADHHRGLALEYEQILKDVRSRAGFEDYLRLKKLADLLPSSTLLDGPVILMNMDSTQCSALIISPNGSIATLALPELTLEKAEALRSQWQLYLHQQCVRERGSIANCHRPHSKNTPGVVHILSCIWRWIVHPILQSLNLSGRQSKDERLPHITWCPTGPLTQLPLHAAGMYDQDSGPRIHDCVVSSYTPSLSALTRAIEANAKRRPPPSVLVVTQSETPGLSPLPGTVVEGERLGDVFSESRMTCSALTGERASTGIVRAYLDDHTWLHLACHGLQDPKDPLQSAFALHDGPLSLRDLMTTTADNAELAFLSACQTAVGDEKIPEESMHLAAGMLAVGYKGVVATMWSIRDDDAPLVVEAYYKKLLGLRASGTLGRAETGAAYALHEATKRLREKIGEKEFVRWAPFVHFGI
ncbi:TPR-like protein [Peniophora sp. CONT]|nr:TPR-like protein [Peniophora sp. CONT]